MKKHLKKFFLYSSVTLLTCAIYSSRGYAFNYDKCTKGVEKYKSFIFLDVMSSTTQFTSSWGECSMLGSGEEEKKAFVSYNVENLKIDISKGGGEYTDTYASLSGCSDNTKKEFAEYLQKNFIKIYSANLDNSPEKIYNNIEQIIKENKKLTVACSGKKLI